MRRKRSEAEVVTLKSLEMFVECTFENNRILPNFLLIRTMYICSNGLRLPNRWKICFLLIHMDSCLCDVQRVKSSFMTVHEC